MGGQDLFLKTHFKTVQVTRTGFAEGYASIAAGADSVIISVPTFGAVVTASKSTGNLVTLGLSASIFRHSLHTEGTLLMPTCTSNNAQGAVWKRLPWIAGTCKRHDDVVPVNEWRIWRCFQISQLVLPILSADIIAYSDELLQFAINVLR